MSPNSIARKKKERYHRALQIAATAGAVTPNGATHQFYVKSQTGNGSRYLAATPEAVAPLGMCSCRDFQDFGQHNGIACKHIYASHIYEQARGYVLRHMERYDLTPQHVVDMASNPSLFRNHTEQSDLRLACIATAAAIISIELQAEKETAANA